MTDVVASTLTNEQLYAIAGDCRREIQKRTTHALHHAVREIVMAHPTVARAGARGATPIRVFIGTDEWDDGYFYASSGQLEFSDASTEWIDLTALHDALTEASDLDGPLGDLTRMRIRL